MALVEVLNAVGVALNSNPSSDESQQKMGGHLIIAAIVIQIVVILIFVALAGTFHFRCRKAKLHAKNVTTMLAVLYTSMALIFIRCLYRLVEHVGNTAIDITDLDKLRALSPLLRYEVYFYIFEASAMLINSVIWNVWHPGRALPRSSRVHLAADGVTEITASKQSDNRPLWAKVLHIATFGLLFRRKKKSASFHELENYRGGSE